MKLTWDSCRLFRSHVSSTSVEFRVLRGTVALSPSLSSLPLTSFFSLSLSRFLVPLSIIAGPREGHGINAPSQPIFRPQPHPCFPRLFSRFSPPTKKINMNNNNKDTTPPPTPDHLQSSDALNTDFHTPDRTPQQGRALIRLRVIPILRAPFGT